MHVTSVDNYNVAPGRVTEWSISVEPGSLTASAVPPSYNQRFHLETARSHGVGHSVWMAAAFDTSGPLDHDALATAFTHFIGRHDALRSGFDVNPDAVQRLVFDIDNVSLAKSAPLDFASSAALREHLRRRFTLECDPLTFPSYLFATIERDSGSTVVCAFDHTVVDGYSLAIAVDELHRTYRHLVIHPDADVALELANPGSFMQYCTQESQESQSQPVRDNDPQVLEWGRFYSGCGGTSPTFPLDLGVEPARPAPQAADVRPLTSAYDTDRFEEACRLRGASLFTGMLTVMGMAIARQGGPNRIPLLFPLHTRRDPRWSNSIGWLTTSGPLTIEVAEDHDFDASLAATHASFRTALTLAGISMSKVHAALGDAHRRTRTDIFMVSYIDYRTLAGNEAHESVNAHHISNVTVTDDAQFWISRTSKGLALRSRFPATDTAYATIDRFLSSTKTLMDEISDQVQEQFAESA